MRHLMFSLVVCSALTAGATARAGTVTVETVIEDDGNVSALIEATSQRFVDAMRVLIDERYKDEYRAIRWEDLDTAMRRSRIARVAYRYTVGTEVRTRVYHAMSGEPLGAMASAAFEGPTRPNTPTTPDSGDDHSPPQSPAPPPEEAIARRVSIDAGDERLFSGLDEVDVRARALPFDDSRLTPYMLDGRDASLDAEYKALRQLETDIRAGVVPAGGQVSGIVDGPVCGSCRGAFQQFSEAYGADVRMTQMFASVTRGDEARLLQSGRARMKGRLLVDVDTGRPLLAYDAINASREAQVRRALSPRSMNRSFKGASWRQRSFRLSAPLPRISERSPDGRPLPSNPDVAQPTPPGC
ncbi:hypothetical protein SAMN02800694_3395 [Luteibacter sp. UNCMF331Sha3.1]|uniref:hypothetical protein n=1 Tax=Luteibacter sp. UNCMF331Sha3.1 TaxID=1502760 RepID=UPI0008ABE7A5|nr:hypothetical protein [Luteibacter sp. UNCMF331Sha3.1]SEN40811.1 hypothetical protein SAMN02800694_3395 [Luteibacter sp. UNCMF331Sha3.1]